MKKTQFEIGKYYEGQGVYIGTYEPVDRDGVSLNKIFNLFAARENLCDVATYNAKLEKVKALKGYDGHRGAQFENDSDLYKALSSGSYNGEWFIPTRDMLKANHNLRKDNQAVTMKTGSLYDLREVGEFKGRFNTTNNGSDFTHCYWSCTAAAVISSGDTSRVYTADFSGSGCDWWCLKDGKESQCLVVRAVPVDFNELFYPSLRRPLKIRKRVKL